MTVKSTYLDEQDLIVYPSSDGKPMADNTRQFNYIMLIKENLEKLFAENKNVFVAGDLFWYPVQGNPRIVYAPDVMVAFGRPKGDRKSYIQHREGNIAPQVVFEILSDANTPTEMIRKTNFYSVYGVEEFYVYNPDTGDFQVYTRQNDTLRLSNEVLPYISPLLGIRFEVHHKELEIFYPNRERFLSVTQLYKELDAERQKVYEEKYKFEIEKQRADAEKQRADTEKQRAERLAAQLRALGIKPDEV
jgi:Uma2 family endonuclease